MMARPDEACLEATAADIWAAAPAASLAAVYVCALHSVSRAMCSLSTAKLSGVGPWGPAAASCPACPSWPGSDADVAARASMSSLLCTASSSASVAGLTGATWHLGSRPESARRATMACSLSGLCGQCSAVQGADMAAVGRHGGCIDSWPCWACTKYSSVACHSYSKYPCFNDQGWSLIHS